MNSQDVLNDSLVIRQILLIRVANGQVFESFAEITALADMLRNLILRSKPLSEMGRLELNRKIKEINGLIKFEAPDLSAIPELEVSYFTTAVDKVVEDAELVIPVGLGALAVTVAISGMTLPARVANIKRNMIFNIEAVVRDLTSRGLSNREISSAIVGNLKVGMKGVEPLKRAVRELSTETRTAIMALASQAREEVYLANPSTFSSATHSSILDSKTSDICKLRDGKSWRLPNYEPVGHTMEFRQTPLHRNCRSLIYYALRNAPARFSAKSDFDDFLSRQSQAVVESLFGKTNIKSYRDGKKSLTELLENKNNVISINQL